MFGATGRDTWSALVVLLVLLVLLVRVWSAPPVVAFWNNLLLDYGCKFLNDNVICEMSNARLPVFLPNLNLMDCSNCLIVSA